MSLVRCLEKILNSEILEKKTRVNGSQTIELKEKQSGMKVKVTGIPDLILAIRTGEPKKAIKHLSSLSERGDWNKICDYLLVFQLGAAYHAVFIELKKSMVQKRRGYEQLIRSLPIWDYLFSVCKIECGINAEPSIRYVLIAEKNADRLNKERVKIKPSKESRCEEHKEKTIKIFIKTTVSVEELAIE